MATTAHYLEGGGRSSAARASRVLLGSLLALARRKASWSPALVAGVMWRAATNIQSRPEVFRLMKLSPYTEHARSHPRFAWKYLTSDYLARGLSVAERAACFVHHYRRLRTAFPEELILQTLVGETTLHQIPEGENRFSLTMGLPQSIDKEGEISLNMRVDGVIVYVLSFAIVPGWVVKSRAEEVFLITQLQGMKGAYRQIREMTKTLYEVAPGAILLAAAQGIASALGIGRLAAVCGTRQSCYDAGYAANFKSGYDDLFAELGMRRNASGFFLSLVPLPEKPLAAIKQGHKLRTREKRAFKRRVQMACAEFLTGGMGADWLKRAAEDRAMRA